MDEKKKPPVAHCPQSHPRNSQGISVKKARFAPRQETANRLFNLPLRPAIYVVGNSRVSHAAQTGPDDFHGCCLVLLPEIETNAQSHQERVARLEIGRASCRERG